MPKLACNVTGLSYYVTKEQLEAKAKAFELEVDKFTTVYVSKKAAQLLQKGHSVLDIRALIDCADETPDLTDDQMTDISNMYIKSNIRRVLSNFSTVSSLAVNESDLTVSEYISFLKNTSK